MSGTTIYISKEIKEELDKLKRYKRETYNEIIQMLLNEYYEKLKEKGVKEEK